MTVLLPSLPALYRSAMMVSMDKNEYQPLGESAQTNVDSRRLRLWQVALIVLIAGQVGVRFVHWFLLPLFNFPAVRVMWWLSLVLIILGYVLGLAAFIRWAWRAWQKSRH